MLPIKLNILFISHEASNTGAPILLLSLLKLLKAEGKTNVRVAIMKDGNLTKDFQKLFPTIVLKSANYSEKLPVGTFVKSRIKNRIHLAKFKSWARDSDVIFANTIITGLVLKSISKLKKPVITYVHELANVFEIYKPTGIIQSALDITSVFAFPCLPVKDNLIDNGVELQRLRLLNYFIPQLPLVEDKDDSSFEKNGLINICGIGTPSSRKGTDVFIETAKLVNEKSRRANFYWIGGGNDVELEVFKESANGFVEFVGGVSPSEMGYFYSNIDLLFLSSREDPYPLVVLEAATFSKPALAYEKSGGIPEFIGDDCGWLVAEYSALAFSRQIQSILQDKQMITLKGNAAKEKVKRQHQDGSFILSQFYNIVDELLRPSID